MGKKLHNFICRRLVCLALAMAVVLHLVPPLPAQAYLQGDYTLKGKSHIGINLMFDSLTAEALQIYQSQLGSLSAEEKKWGHKGNPYVIDNDRHLQNLYILQNSGQITPGSHFLVCTPEGKPVAVGSQSSSAEPIQPVGNGSHPFTGTMGGAFQSGTATLSTGETINGSAIDGVQVDGSGKIDVGFFGMVGPGAKVENLIFANVTIQGSGTAPADPSHTYYKDVKTDKPQSQRKDPQETSHIGIIAGHVERATMKKLSVYYSSTQQVALDLAGGTDANYLCGTGFFGLLDHLNPNDPGGGFNNDDFVSGGGSEGGGLDSGLNPGYVRAEQMFQYRPGSVGQDDPVQLRDLLENGKSMARLSSDGKLYIHDGVFSFTLSRGQDDTIENIWPKSQKPQGLSLMQMMAQFNLLADGTEGQQYGEASEAVPPEEIAPETTAPEQPDTQEKQVEVVFRKEPADTRLSVFSLNDRGERIPHLSIGETEKKMAEAGMDPATLDLSAVQSIKTWDKDNVYLLAPGSYYVTARREGYEPMEAQSFTVDERSDTMRIQIRLLPLVEETTEPPTDPPEPPTDGATEPAETEAPQETEPPAETETVPAETDPIPADPVPAETETQAPIEAPTVYRVPSRASALPDLYFGETDTGEEMIPPEEPSDPVPADPLPEQNAEPQPEQDAEILPEEMMPELAPPVPEVMSDGSGVITFTVRPKEATLTVEEKLWGNYQAIQPIRSSLTEDGLGRIYVYQKTDQCVYSYTAVLPGYQKKSGTAGSSNWHGNLEDEAFDLIFPPTMVNFACDVPGLIIDIHKKEDTGYRKLASVDPTKPLPLYQGEYCWTAEKFGYEEKMTPGSKTAFSVTTSAVSPDPVPVHLQKLPAALAKFIYAADTPADARLTIVDLSSGRMVYDGNAAELELPQGRSYQWKVTRQGYVPQTGTIQIMDGAEQTITVELQQLKEATVTFSCTPADAKLSVKTGNQLVEPTAEDPHVYVLYDTVTYHWTASAKGYYTASGTETISGEQPVTIPVTLVPKPKATVKFAVTPKKATITVQDEDGQAFAPDSAGNYQLPEGNYTFTAECKGYTGVHRPLKITAGDADKEKVISLTLEKVQQNDQGYPLPPEGAIPPVIGQPDTSDLSTITLAPAGDWTFAEGISSEGRYNIHLTRLTSLNQIHTGSLEDVRYFICPKGYAGNVAGQDPAYLSVRLGGTAQKAVGPFGAQKPEQCSASVKGNELILSFTSPEKRLQAVGDLGLQIRNISGGYEIYQSVYDGGSWIPKYYLGLGEMKNELDTSKSGLVRAVASQDSKPGIDEFTTGAQKLFKLSLQDAGGGSFNIRANGATLKYEREANIKKNLFRATGGGVDSFEIYQITKYSQETKGQGKFVVPEEKNPLRVSAADHVFFYRSPGNYDLIALADLGAKGWKQNSGVLIDGSYQPDKMFNMKHTSMVGNLYIGKENVETIIKVPLDKKKPDTVYEIPTGTMGFYVNAKPEDQKDLFVRVICLFPRSTDTYSGSNAGDGKVGIWTSNTSSGFKPSDALLSIPMPVSQPMTQSQNRSIRVNYEGQSYVTYLQGEIYMTAVELNINDLNSAQKQANLPGGFFLTETNYPMQLIYCAAEGIADGSDQPGPDPTKGNLDTIDFVYTLNGQVIPVTDSRYVKSNQILQFDNFAKGSGSPYVKIYTGSALLFRQAMQASPGPGDPRITHTLSPYMKMQEIGSPSDSLDPPRK